MDAILETAKRLLEDAVKEDSVVVDFTMGNGHDTLFLAGLVPRGKVYAFDIQPTALANTKVLLAQEGLLGSVELILQSHHRADAYLPDEINAGMFNLGYLPYGDHEVTTKLATTLEAVTKAVGLLAKGGCLVIVVYPGHPEGEKEGSALTELLGRLDKKRFDVLYHRLINVAECPFILAVERRK